MVDPESPFAAGLDCFYALDEGEGTFSLNRTGNGDKLTGFLKTSWGASDLGKCFKSNGTQTGTAPCRFPDSTASGSSSGIGPPPFVYAARVQTSTIAAGTPGAFSIGTTTESANPTCLLQRTAATLRALDGDFAFVNLATMVVGTWYDVVAVWDGTGAGTVAPTGTMKYWVYDQKQLTKTTSTGVWSSGGITAGAPSIFVGDGFNARWSGQVDYVGLWLNTFWTDDQCVGFITNPFQILERRPAKRWFMPPAPPVTASAAYGFDAIYPPAPTRGNSMVAF